MDLTDFLTLYDGAKSVAYGNCVIGVKCVKNNGKYLFFVYLNGKNVVTYTTITEYGAFIDGVENAIKAQTQCNVTDAKTQNK